MPEYEVALTSKVRVAVDANLDTVEQIDKANELGWERLTGQPNIPKTIPKCVSFTTRKVETVDEATKRGFGGMTPITGICPYCGWKLGGLHYGDCCPQCGRTSTNNPPVIGYTNWPDRKTVTPLEPLADVPIFLPGEGKGG